VGGSLPLGAGWIIDAEGWTVRVRQGDRAVVEASGRSGVRVLPVLVAVLALATSSLALQPGAANPAVAVGTVDRLDQSSTLSTAAAQRGPSAGVDQERMQNLSRSLAQQQPPGPPSPPAADGDDARETGTAGSESVVESASAADAAPARDDAAPDPAPDAPPAPGPVVEQADDPAPAPAPPPAPSAPEGPATQTAQAPSDPPLGQQEPTRVVVPRIGVTNPLVPVGLHPDRTLVVPEDERYAGWYTGAPRPGQRGPAVITGHNSWNGRAGVFKRLHELQPGDTIEVHHDAGAVVRFVVDRIEQHPKDAFPTQHVYGNTDGPELRVITCGGIFDQRRRSHVDNIVVFASRTA
jgi:sortase (surface protein transpeptidase)